MKAIQDLLVESEQLRIERDDFGPQVEVEYWKTRAAKLTLLVEQITSMPCKMTLVTLRAGNCKLLKVRHILQTITWQTINHFRCGIKLT